MLPGLTYNSCFMNICSHVRDLLYFDVSGAMSNSTLAIQSFKIKKRWSWLSRVHSLWMMGAVMPESTIPYLQPVKLVKWASVGVSLLWLSAFQIFLQSCLYARCASSPAVLGLLPLWARATWSPVLQTPSALKNVNLNYMDTTPLIVKYRVKPRKPKIQDYSFVLSHPLVVLQSSEQRIHLWLRDLKSVPT